jgi:transposase
MVLQRRPIRFTFHFHLLDDNVNCKGESVASFVKRVRETLNGPITVLWDDYCIHRAKPVKDYVERIGSIEIEEFPPYAPELNPVDYVWSYIKYGRLANFCPKGLSELREAVTKELVSVAEQPRLLRALFSRTGLSLDGLGGDANEEG